MQIWEPMLARLFSGPARALISEVWTFEAVQHGDSALINDAAQRDVGEWLWLFFHLPSFD